MDELPLRDGIFDNLFVAQLSRRFDFKETTSLNFLFGLSIRKEPDLKYFNTNQK
ncbi:hypothetical protein [Leptospira santarosai]|uniref:hypothetical protein n=1 Tax=Leptospira santarosai TaxID=28183 RepID=UPI00138F1849|nr:hypothetical protein [Leptospira santarosai]